MVRSSKTQELSRRRVWQQQPHHLLIPREYLLDHPTNPLATDYAEIGQNALADPLLRGAREAPALLQDREGGVTQV
jgi:hypothetical protein